MQGRPKFELKILIKVEKLTGQSHKYRKFIVNMASYVKVSKVIGKLECFHFMYAGALEKFSYFQFQHDKLRFRRKNNIWRPTWVKVKRIW